MEQYDILITRNWGVKVVRVKDITPEGIEFLYPFNTEIQTVQRDTIMSAPLVLRGQAIGAINAWRQRSDGLFNESELNFLVSIANQTSLLIDSNSYNFV